MSHHVLGAHARWSTAFTLACLTATISATACSAAAAKSTTTKTTLTIAVAGPPTLDPYKANLDLNNVPTVALAYASLIRLNADRTFSGDLAESFGYGRTWSSR